jgi:anti-anti-sigma regulatory factor
MELVFFSAIGAVAMATVGLGILNWLYLSAISSKVTNLENEVEKKALEFESAKKERQALALAAKNAMPTQDGMGTPAPQTESPQIEVVRNVRGSGFDHVDMEMGSHKRSLPHPDVQEPDQAIEAPAYRVPSSSAPIAAKPFDETFEPTTFEPETESQPSASHVRENALTVALYSRPKQDTDFAAAWKTLSELLPTHQNPNVMFDFSGVLFLYEQELQYLEKFKDIVLRSGGNVSFVNCHEELVDILRNRPALAPIVGPQQQ